MNDLYWKTKSLKPKLVLGLCTNDARIKYVNHGQSRETVGAARLIVISYEVFPC